MRRHVAPRAAHRRAYFRTPQRLRAPGSAAGARRGASIAELARMVPEALLAHGAPWLGTSPGAGFPHMGAAVFSSGSH
eukprot:848803-Pyramimonas_sp.AAC.1